MEKLFSETRWETIERTVHRELEREINIWPENQLLNTSVDDLCQYFAKKYETDIPVINKYGIVTDAVETMVQVRGGLEYAVDDQSQPTFVRGLRITFAVPFTGDPMGFRYEPVVVLDYPPDAYINMSDSLVSGSLVFEFIRTDTELEPDMLRTEFDNQLGIIEDYLDSLRDSANTLNRQLHTLARKSIEVRRERLLSYRNLVASIGYPLRQREDSPRTYTAPEVRRVIRPSPPKASSEPYQPEPALDHENYEYVLGVIENMARVMECSPAAFSDMGEDMLRWHFLVQLNGHYEWQATGETFNYEGKTDILIRSKGKNIFIAECKYWGGPDTLTGAINQLLGYSSWRDTKVAVIVFNRNKNFTGVLDSIKATAKKHQKFKRELDQNSETSFPYIFSHRDDVNRELTLTIMAFDVPSL